MEISLGGLFGGSPSIPVPAAPPPAAAPATMANPNVAQSAASNRMKAAAGAYNASNTVGTNPQGLQAPATASSTLLGGTSK